MKKLFTLLFMCLFFVFTTHTVRAETQADDGVRVIDDARIITESDVATLQAEVEAFIKHHNMDLVIVTTNDAQGKTSEAYADDYYDYNGYGIGSDYSGALILVDMDNRMVYISTTGRMINYLSDERLDRILDHMTPKVSKAKYTDAFQIALTDIGTFVELGFDDGSNTFPEKVKEEVDPITTTLGGAATGGIIAFFRRRSLTKKYNPTIPGFNLASHYNAEYMPGEAETELIDTNTSSAYSPLPRATYRSSSATRSRSSAPRSTTHRSSSGRTHGGKGRGF
ncbi:TPM domain-containing protein [Erysipelothrix sp. HDW6C]|uniref:TPM domain-containing protein n=1 Tax=Erysipelothrix sp. HDW6C TaxID=2714930 RepID=UPI00140DC9F6|nr:TPM domain-containing protein [Erysipelothrix sp. HDW6C]QIK70569.1 TPM domain-containing protein [Erysipelothrix sp. HDW6C]